MPQNAVQALRALSRRVLQQPMLQNAVQARKPIRRRVLEQPERRTARLRPTARKLKSLSGRLRKRARWRRRTSPRRQQVIEKRRIAMRKPQTAATRPKQRIRAPQMLLTRSPPSTHPKDDSSACKRPLSLQLGLADYGRPAVTKSVACCYWVEACVEWKRERWFAPGIREEDWVHDGWVVYRGRRLPYGWFTARRHCFDLAHGSACGLACWL